jgi:glycosyltransferase involved in cell wall biosynthesis
MPAADHSPLSVVISTVDRPALLARCLAALREGVRRPHEVVVVDQGGTTGTADVVADAREAGLTVVHVVQSGRGLSLSQNAGVRAATSEVVAIVDDDCVPSPQWLAVAEREFGAGTRPLLLTGRVLPGPIIGHRTIAVSSRLAEQRREWTNPPLPWHIGTGGNFAVDRAAFLSVGGNDVRLGTGAPGRGSNDLDLFHRLIVGGTAARYAPEFFVHHERSTPSEYRRRRTTYGFGVGAMLGLWLRRHDRRALTVLVGWLRLRAARLARRRDVEALGLEARVVAATVAGLAHGLCLRTSAASTDG